MDSGAVALGLKELNISFNTVTIVGDEDVSVVQQRKAMLENVATMHYMTLKSGGSEYEVGGLLSFFLNIFEEYFLFVLRFFITFPN